MRRQLKVTLFDAEISTNNMLWTKNYAISLLKNMYVPKNCIIVVNMLTVKQNSTSL